MKEKKEEVERHKCILEKKYILSDSIPHVYITNLNLESSYLILISFVPKSSTCGRVRGFRGLIEPHPSHTTSLVPRE